ncbi:hypothetical protein SOVF_185660, partial [Spinacia oleracea]
ENNPQKNPIIDRTEFMAGHGAKRPTQ